MVNITVLNPRRRYISEACSNSIGSEHVYLRGKHQLLPVIKIPLSLLVYRANNGRLAVAEASYLSKHNLGADFFEIGEEMEEVQSALHEMLLELAKNPAALIYQELDDSGVQTERLLLTSDGVVLDGNRRLASMRTLYEKDSSKYHTFGEIEAAILPEDSTESDFEMVEATKQMAPDLKLQYGWLDRRLKLRHHRDYLSLPIATICNAYRLKSEEQLHNELEELELAERYLKEYIEQPSGYNSIDYAEEYFVGLREQLANLPDNYIRLTWLLVGFAMIKEANKLEIEPNQYFPFTSSKRGYEPVSVLELYGGENDLWPYIKELGSGAILKKSNYKTLVQFLNQPTRSLEIARDFRRLFNQMVSEFEEHPNPIAIINRLKQINNLLGRAELEHFTESQRSELFGQLAETSYQFQYLTQSEDRESIKPVIVTGFTPLFNRIIKSLVVRQLWIKDKLKALFSRK